MNCEFSGNLSSNETEVEELNDTFVIKRTSLRLESGVGPMGMMGRVYGGEPVPVILTSRFRH